MVHSLKKEKVDICPVGSEMCKLCHGTCCKLCVDTLQHACPVNLKIEDCRWLIGKIIPTENHKKQTTNHSQFGACDHFYGLSTVDYNKGDGCGSAM